MLEAVVGVWVGKNGHGVPLMGVDDDASRLARKCARPARPLSRPLAPVRLARQGSRRSLPRGSSTTSIPEFRKRQGGGGEYDYDTGLDHVGHMWLCMDGFSNAVQRAKRKRLCTCSHNF